MSVSWEILLNISKGIHFWTDPYYEMNAANLNTMNSYFIPAQANIDPSNYPDLNVANFFGQWIDLHIMSSYPWILILIWLFALLWRFIRKKKLSGFTTIFTSLYESVYYFFEGILWEEKEQRMKNFVTTMFFIILFSNLLWIFNDMFRFFFPRWLRNVTSPTAELEFNVALALISVWVTLYVQAKHLWLWRFFLEYLPINWKWLIEGNSIWAKIWDIIISMFIWILDIVWTLAKIVSLSMRLFGNMSSWSILLNVAFLWLGAISISLIWFNLPLALPWIIYIQWLLVAFIQAFVFALLTSIFLKLSSE